MLDLDLSSIYEVQEHSILETILGAAGRALGALSGALGGVKTVRLDAFWKEE